MVAPDTHTCLNAVDPNPSRVDGSKPRANLWTLEQQHHCISISTQLAGREPIRLAAMLAGELLAVRLRRLRLDEMMRPGLFIAIDASRQALQAIRFCHSLGSDQSGMFARIASVWIRNATMEAFGKH